MCPLTGQILNTDRLNPETLFFSQTDVIKIYKTMPKYPFLLNPNKQCDSLCLGVFI